MLSDCLSRVLSTAREESNLICGVASVAEALERFVADELQRPAHRMLMRLSLAVTLGHLCAWSL